MKIRSQYNLLYFVIFLILSVTACKAIIEPSISNSKIVALAPANGAKSTTYNTTFWWEPVEDALYYNLQVVSPDFNNISRLVADTVIRSNKFTLSLKPGDYQWRVQALNGSSNTLFTSARTFTIFLSSIKGQAVQLQSPPNNFVTNQATAGLQWSSLYGATRYVLQIDTNNFVDESKLVYNQALAAQQYTFTFPKDQTYQWRVRAENDTAKADWSAVNIMLHDRTPPAPVNLIAPANNAQVNLPASLQWGATTTAAKYKLYVFKNDGVTPYNNSFPMTLNGTNYNFNVGNVGEQIVWKVSAIDAAGNEGQPSVARSFTLRL